jgi:hypothetical protein
LLFELAASAIELTDGPESNWLNIGAQKFLAGTTYRKDGNSRIAICESADILRRVSEALTSTKGFSKGRLTEYQLELASKLPDRSWYVIEAVAASAFNPNVQPSDVFNFRDIRPYARTVLASFGPSVSKFGQLAYDQISSATSMGTGAAQVAAAGAHPQALARIEKLMEEALASVPVDQAIPREMRNRLYELSWAIYFAGDAGKKHTKSMHKVMRRQVQSWAPPFGMVNLPPKRLCALLIKIEGEKSVQDYGFCSDENVPLEQ